MSARITGVAAAAAAVDREIADLGKGWTLELDLPAAPRAPYRTLRPRARAPGPQPTNAEVIDHLAAMRRDVFALTDADRATLTSLLVGQYRAGLRGAALWTAIGSAWRGRVVERMRAGAGQRPVSPAWAARKARLGYPTTPSVASGQLADAIRSALVRVRRTR